MDMQKLEKNAAVLRDRAQKGLRGDYKVGLHELIMVVGNICNAHCIMCPNIIYGEHGATYLNENPWTLSLEEYKEKQLPRLKYLPRFLWPSKKFYNSNVVIRFDQGESFFNKDFPKILKYTKETLPNSQVVLLTNGSNMPEKWVTS